MRSEPPIAAWTAFTDDIRGDIAIYSEDGDGRWYFMPGFWIAATHRVGSTAHRVKNPALRFSLLATHKLLSFPWRTFKGVHIPHNMRIGPGLRLPHPQNILLAPGGSMGANCSIYHDVTIGRSASEDVPRIGDRVMVYPGARIVGGIRVGDDARIGTNAIANRDVPDGAEVVAPPSRIIPRETADVMGGRGARPMRSTPR